MKWIGVKDRKPETGGDCLVTLKGTSIYIIAYYDGNEWEVPWCSDCYDFDDEVTHWMYLSRIPLPSPPKDA